MVTPGTQVDSGQAAPEVPVLAAPAIADAPPAAQPAVEAPRPPPPTVVPPRMPSEVEVLRRRLAEVEAEKQTQATEVELLNEARTVQREASARGLSEEDALWVAQRHYTVAKRVGQERQQLQAQQKYIADKQEAAEIIGREEGVDPSLLMTGNSAGDMYAIAQREKRYAASEARLKALEQRQVPQNLDAANSGRAGNVAVTTDNIDQLWLEHEINHPGQANPYEAQYRKLLAG